MLVLLSAIKYSMTLSNQIDHDSDNRQSFVPEGWIQALADRVKETQHATAETAAVQARRTSLLWAQGPIFWREFRDSINRFGNDITQVLKGDPSQSNFLSLPGAYSSLAAPLTITRTLFPAFEFTASPQFSTGTIEMKFRKANPGPLLTAQAYEIIPCSFELTPSGLLVLLLNGREFFKPEEAAKCMIKMLFSAEKEKAHSSRGRETKIARAAKG